jgi:hypothetical protein
VKKLVQLVAAARAWANADAGQGCEGVESKLQLSGWSRERRVLVLRRKLAQKRKRPHGNTKHKPFLPFQHALSEAGSYEYAVLDTALTDEICTITQPYRDRADAENNFDELKDRGAQAARGWVFVGTTLRGSNLLILTNSN